MEISLSWLREFTEITETPEELANRLTLCGLEVEGIAPYEPVKGGLEGLVIGEVLTCEKHPDADKLHVTQVDLGESDPVQIVCGAPNVAAGQKVVVAKVQATLYPTEGSPFTIKKTKIRGQVSEGMICAEDEIGLGHSHDGIMVLDTNLPNGTPASQYFQIPNDTVFTIGLTPNRADAASHYGVARDIRAVLNRPLAIPYPHSVPEVKGNLPIGVRIEAPEACMRYAGITVEGITVKESPDWLKHKLQAIGLTPINNVVDITNFVLHGLGQPLHAFDAAKIKGGNVVVKTLTEGTPFVTLDGKTRKLSAHDLMICNEEAPMCIGGVYGGLDSGVSIQTTSVFIESAWFDPQSIRKTSQRHGLKTDASFRFERGTDPEMVIPALLVAANMVAELTGGKIASEVVDVYPQPVGPRAIALKRKNIDRLIGKVIPEGELLAILERLEIVVKATATEGYQVEVPRYRVDVEREADVIEEILRVYGYENVEESPYLKADFLASFPAKDPVTLQRVVTHMLASAGMHEIMTNSLTNPAYTQALGFEEGSAVAMVNPNSAELAIMRQHMVTSGLEAVRYNLNRRQKDLKLFEFGKVYRKEGEQFAEELILALFLTGDEEPENWLHKPAETNFHQLAGYMTRVFEKMRIRNYQSVPLSAQPFAWGLEYRLGKKVLAQAGLVSPTLQKLLDVSQPVFHAVVYWETLVALYSPDVVYQEIPKFPEVRRDLSMVIDQQTSFDDICRVALQKERKLLKAINVFDVYEGKNVGEGKKSYAVSFILQDAGKTLDDRSIDQVMQKLIRAFTEELGIAIRGVS